MGDCELCDVPGEALEMKRALLNAAIILAASLAIETEYVFIGGAVTLFLLATFAGLSQMRHRDSK